MPVDANGNPLPSAAPLDPAYQAALANALGATPQADVPPYGPNDAPSADGLALQQQSAALGQSLASGHSGDDLVGWLGANLPKTSSPALAYGTATAAMPLVAGARAVDGLTNAASWARDVQTGRYGTFLDNPDADRQVVPGAVQAAMTLGAPGLGMAEEGALGAAGGRMFVNETHNGTPVRSFLSKEQAQVAAAAYDRKAASIRASGGDAAALSEAESNAASMRAALPHFDALPPEPVNPGAGRFTAAKIAPAGDRAVSVATDPRHAPFDDVRTYRVYPQPEGGLDGVTRARDLGRPLGYAEMKQREDGRWEVGMVQVNPSARGQGVARDLYSGIEADLGQKMQPSGILLPDGYAMWQRRDPTAVQWHQPVQSGDGSTYHVSPRWLQEQAGGWAQSDPAFDASMRAALDRVPPEGRTPEAINAMFSGSPVGGSTLSSQPSPAQPDAGDPLHAALLAQANRQAPRAADPLLEALMASRR